MIYDFRFAYRRSLSDVSPLAKTALPKPFPGFLAVMKNVRGNGGAPRQNNLQQIRRRDLPRRLARDTATFPRTLPARRWIRPYSDHHLLFNRRRTIRQPSSEPRSLVVIECEIKPTAQHPTHQRARTNASCPQESPTTDVVKKGRPP